LHEDGRRQPTEDSLLQVMHQLMQAFTRVYIVLDALDECSQRDKLMQVCSTTGQWGLLNSHVVATSRRERDIEVVLAGIGGHENSMILESGLVDEDIRRYVRQRLSEDKALSKWARDYTLRDEIETALMKGSQGGQLSRYSMNIDTCHARLARACLEYLQQILQVRRELEEHLRISKLLPYCSDYWMSHMNRADKCEIGTARIAAQFLSSGSTAYRSWLEIYQVGIPWLYPDNITPEHKAVNPLYYAASFDLVGVLRVLLDEGADVNTQNSQYIRADQLAVVDELERKAVSLLAQGDAKDAWTRHYGSPLRAASELGHEQVVRLLLNAGADTNSDTPVHGSALNMAVSSEEVTIVSLLLKNGADVEAIWCNDGTPLIMAASKGHSEIVELLLNRGATLSATDSYGWTPLISAAAKGRTETVKLLLENGADIESADYEGCTPLIYAAHNGHFEVVDLLISMGADVSAMSKDGQTPLIAAAYKDHYYVAKLLLEHETSNGLLSVDLKRRVTEGCIGAAFLVNSADRTRGLPWNEPNRKGSGWWLHERPGTIHIQI
jgi:ankyrin repeat protein